MGAQNVKAGELMSAHTTFKVGGPADLFLTPESEEALIAAVHLLGAEGIPFFVLGNGSNVLVRDGGIRGAVLCVGQALGGIRTEGSEITAGAGELLVSLSHAAAKAGLTGLEFASGIPGSVGGALYMNAGAYDGEMRDVVISARVYDPAAQAVRQVQPEEMALGYRSSRFQAGDLLILSVTVRLTPGSEEQIREKMRQLMEKRNAKQPVNMASAGSFFKRPPGQYAGALIEQAGMKGYRVGGAMVSDKHAGFVVNTGGATAADVLAVMQAVQERVRETSGHWLMPEPAIIGEDHFADGNEN